MSFFTQPERENAPGEHGEARFSHFFNNLSWQIKMFLIK